ncbi:MAG TPA: tRNA (cytidine(34)-2'-O)-methyltransferase, partial [Deinococcales bacterium]|nr:tRNA (cytidine(34)-2'-O)-methyltransferase [Deinococcales bacterium]
PAQETTPLLQVALYQPEIAQNAGSVARTCAVLGARLHLIRPLGFQLAGAGVRRAGMDYLEGVDLRVHVSFAAFEQDIGPAARIFAASARGRTVYTAAGFEPGDVILLGPESVGLPEEILAAFPSVFLPMPGGGRSLNLAVSAGVLAFEAMRQISGGWAAAAPARPA